MQVKAEYLKTDSLLVAVQFRLLGIPVFVPTAVVRQALEIQPQSLVLAG